MIDKDLSPSAAFPFTARPAQCAPPGTWQAWLFMGGRGAGKTRAGAEWVRRLALFGGHRRIALVGPSYGDIREVMIEGPSGLRAISRPGETPPKYEVSRHRLVWPNGAEAHAFSAEDPEALRGPQFDAAWCDEIAAWQHGRHVWDMLQMTLRRGPHPRVAATTTPRQVELVQALVADAETVITRSATRENAAHLSPHFLTHVERTYANTRLGLQELEGQLLDVPQGTLWSRDQINRVTLSLHPGPLGEVIVAVDPPAGMGANADACGIIVAGRRPGEAWPGTAYILADASVQGLSPLGWASRVADAARRFGASRIVAEANQGGEMVRSVLMQAGCDCPIILRLARLSKRERANPVAALYEQGRVFHIGPFRELEDEMLAFGAPGTKGSPDRVDALVWALTDLLIDAAPEPKIRRL